MDDTFDFQDLRSTPIYWQEDQLAFSFAMGEQSQENQQGLSLDNFNSDLQAKIASKMTTSDLARMRVRLASAKSLPHCFSAHSNCLLNSALSAGDQQILEGNCRPTRGNPFALQLPVSRWSSLKSSQQSMRAMIGCRSEKSLSRPPGDLRMSWGSLSNRISTW